MKKNKMMRIASVLLIAVLLSTSVISGTFAKYVTSDGVADSARVAKFGVVVTGSGSLFDQTYYAADPDASYVPVEGVDGNTPGAPYTEDTYPYMYLTVESSNGEKVVAPGTKNTDGMSIAVTGTPEVDVEVAITATALEQIFLAGGMENLPDMTTGDQTDVFGTVADYYPIMWTLTREFDNPGGDSPAKEVLTTYSWAAIQEKMESFAGRYDANTDLKAAIGTFTLTWEWAFEEAGAPTGYDLATSDKCDTLLGDLAAGIDLTPERVPALEAGINYNLNTSVAFEVSVTQID